MTALGNREIVQVGGQKTSVGNVSNWRGLVATFIASQDVMPSSRSLYTRTLTQYFRWLQTTGREIDALTRIDILAYKDFLIQKNFSTLTIASYITAVRKFYDWSSAETLYPNIASGIKTPKKIQSFKKQHLTEEKINELLDYFKEGSARNYAIVNLMLRTGLRTIEVIRADIGDITFKGNRRVMMVWGKGHTEKDNFVILTDKAYDPIAEYLAQRNWARVGEPLFVSESRRNRGDRLTTTTISGICKKGLRHIGLDGKEFTAHSLRHTTAVEMLKHGNIITDVQEVLRHSSPATTQIYTESVKEELRLERARESTLDEAF